MRMMLTDTVTTKRKTAVRSNSDITYTWANQIASLPCMVQRMSGDEVEKYDREASIKMYKLFCTATDDAGTDRDILAKDRVDWGSRSFDIKTVFNEYGHHLRIEMEEVL